MLEFLGSLQIVCNIISVLLLGLGTDIVKAGGYNELYFLFAGILLFVPFVLFMVYYIVICNIRAMRASVRANRAEKAWHDRFDKVEEQDKNLYNNHVEEKEMNNNLYIRQGWQCPVCGAVMAPDEKSCINCKGNTTSVWGTGGTGKVVIPPTTTCDDKNSGVVQNESLLLNCRERFDSKDSRSKYTKLSYSSGW